MQPIKITVSSTRAVCSERPDPITTGMVGLRAEFIFSADWDGLQKTAVCAGSGVTKDVLNVQDAITIPHECLTDPASDLKIGVYGVNSSGDLVIPTVYAYCGRLFRGADPSGDTSTDYTLPIWAQLQAMIGDLSNLTTTARDNLVAAINEAAKSGGGGSGIVIDSTLTQSGQAADAAVVGNRLSALSEEIGNLQTSILTTAQVKALDGMFKVCAFIKADVSEEYNAFCTAFGIEAATITGISATYSGGSVAVGTAVTDLTGIVVTANYSDGSKKTVTGYTLSGTIAEGSNTITVTYEGMTTTFTVTGVAEEVTLTSISATYSGGDVTVGTAVTDLTGIVVTAHYSDGSTATVTGYTLSGTIAEGSNTVTVTYQGKTATFTVTGVTGSGDVSDDTQWTNGVAYKYTVVADEYVSTTDGSLVSYSGWCRTPYLKCDGASKLRAIAKVESSALLTTGANTSYNAFYDKNKSFIQSFSFLFESGYAVGDCIDIAVPENAVYFILSGPKTSIGTNDHSGKPIVDFIPYA